MALQALARFLLRHDGAFSLGCRIDKNYGNSCRSVAAVDPGMLGSALNHDVTRFESDHLVVKGHINFTQKTNDIVHRIGSVLAMKIIARQ